MATTRAALFDELEKIAEEQPQPLSNREKFKRWLKSAALTAAGAGAGTAAGMVADRVIGPHLGKPGGLARTLPILGLTALGGVASHKLLQAQIAAQSDAPQKKAKE